MSSNYKLPTTGNDFLSSVNEWEKSSIPGLTVFDMNCKPRQLLPETLLLTTGELVPNEIQISMSKLERIFDNEFKCPICLDTIESTSTVTACLHRFCSECIQKSLRMTVGPDKRHECPSCRAKLASRRASKPDTQFDELIQLLLTTQSRGVGAPNGISRSTSNNSGAGGGTRTYKYDPLTSLGKRGGGGGGGGGDGESKMDLVPYWEAHRSKVNEFKNKSMATQKDLQNKKANDSNKRAKTSHNGVPSNNNRTHSANGGAAGQGGPNGKSGNGAAAHSHSGLPPVPGIDPSKVLFGLFPLPEWMNDAKCETEVNALRGMQNPDMNYEDCTLRSPYLRVPCLLKIGDLKQYIKKKYLLPPVLFSLLEIIAKHDNRMIILDEYLTMRDVTTQFWDCGGSSGGNSNGSGGVVGEFKLFFRMYRAIP